MGDWKLVPTLPVICVCKGIACQSCGKQMSRRPISDHHEEAKAQFVFDELKKEGQSAKFGLDPGKLAPKAAERGLSSL